MEIAEPDHKPDPKEEREGHAQARGTVSAKARSWEGAQPFKEVNRVRVAEQSEGEAGERGHSWTRWA